MRDSPNSLTTLRRRLGDERGVALVMALVITASLAISTTAVAMIMVSNENLSGRDREAARALNVAEAGLNNALSVISQTDATGSQASGSTLSSTSFSLDGGSGTYSATKSTASLWTISATGTAPSGDVTRHLQLQVEAESVTSGTAASPVYGYGFFVGSSTGCTNTIGNGTINVSVFVRNNLCLTGNAKIEEPGALGGTLSVYVGGSFNGSGNARIGASTKKVAAFTAVGGCNFSGAVICSNSAQSKVYANAYSSTPSTVTKPTVDPAAVYASGNWNAPTCSVGSFVFDNNAARNASLGTVDFLQNNGRPSFDCTVSNPAGTQTVGRLAWDVSTKVLTISGTIFVDGGLSLAGNSQARYSGSGTIYANGTVSASGNTSLCGPPAIPSGSSCSGQWDPAQGALQIVALNGWSMSGNSEMNVIAYVVGHYTGAGNAVVTGPVIADTATLAGNAKFVSIPTPPPGAPGGSTVVTTTTWSAVPGSWRQLPNAGT
jgi:Tfp pilus assembly protein PilX